MVKMKRSMGRTKLNGRKFGWKFSRKDVEKE